MNYLAHIFLSGEDPLIQLGNFVGDWIKGPIKNIKDKYPDKMLKGVRMHRFIDSFTDSNSIVQSSINKMRPTFGKYSGIIIDVVYDHFLAINWSKYSEIELQQFATRFYNYCLIYNYLLPRKVQQIIPHMLLTNRLKSYEDLEGIRAALTTMSCQTSLPNHADEAIEIVKENFDALNSEFQEFWEIIYNKCKNFE